MTVGMVLAGGQSRRFGSSKAAALFHGTPLLHRTIETLGDVTADVRVVGDAKCPIPPGIRWRADIEPGTGPLGGLETALRWAAEDDADSVLLLAVDMPLVPPGILREIADHPGGDIVVPESTGPAGIEPLCARYGVGILGLLRAARQDGIRSLRAFLSLTGASRIPLEEVRRHGDPDRIFLNVNTLADLAQAEAHHVPTSSG